MRGSITPVMLSTPAQALVGVTWSRRARPTGKHIPCSDERAASLRATVEITRSRRSSTDGDGERPGPAGILARSTTGTAPVPSPRGAMTFSPYARRRQLTGLVGALLVLAL